MKKLELPIKWMHCKSCVINVQDSIEEIKNVEKVEVSLSKKKAIVYYKWQKPDENIIKDELKRLWYDIWYENPSLLTNKIEVYRDILVWIVLLLLWYIFLYQTGYLNFANSINTTSAANFGWWFFVWLIAWVSTCAALVWGLVLSLWAKWSKDHWGRWNFKLQAFFHIWRLLSFAILGGLLWVLWSVIWFTNLTYSIIYIIIWLIILQIWINLSWVSPKLSAYSIAMPSFLFKKLRSKTENLWEKFYATGIWWATFFVPCGFSMAAQLFAVTTGSFWQWSLVMLSFALGSMIPLLWFGSISSFLKWAFGQVVFRVIAVFLVAIWAYNFTVWYTTLSSSISFETSAAAEEQDYDSEYESLKLAIDGMFCISCVMRIESSIGSLDGVESVNVDLRTETADVEYDPEVISADEIIQADIFDDDLYSVEIID